MSASALTKKREYIRCRIACSTPPMYWSTGIQPARHLTVPRRPVVMRVAVAHVVPARVDERVHGVGLARAGAAARRASGVHPVLGSGQRRAASRLVVLDVRQHDRQVVFGHRDHAALLAVDDRDRAAPVPLARDQPVAQLVADREVALALPVEPLHDRPLAVHGVQAGEPSRVDQDLVLGVRRERRAVGLRRAVARWPARPRAPHHRFLIARRHHRDDREPERLGEVVVTLVVRRHRHDRAGAVLHQHVVRDEHRHLLVGDRIGHGAAEWDAGLWLVGRTAQLGRLGQRPVDVFVNPLLVLGPGGQLEHVRVLGRHHEEGRAEQRVRPVVNTG